MLAYIVRRTLIAAFTLVVISFISFVIIQLPPRDILDYIVMEQGDDSAKAYNPDYQLTPEDIAEIRHRWGLNRPLVVQWADWVHDIVRGDWGYWVVGGGQRLSIGDIVAERVPPTIALAAFVIVVTWTFAIPVGIYSAVRQHSIGDYAFTFLGFTGLAIPDFLFALVLMYLLFYLFGMSVGGLFSADYREAAWSFAKVTDMLKHLVIPGIVLGAAGTAGLIRIMRNNLLDELRKPYVVTARAKGLPAWRAIAKYPVRVAINPFVSGIGAMVPALISGSVIVSVVLSLPTLGPVVLIALQQQQPQLGGTIILLLATLTVVGTLVSDLLLVVVDPRIRLTGSR